MANSPGRKQINIDFRGHDQAYEFLKLKPNLRQYIIGLVEKDMDTGVDRVCQQQKTPESHSVSE